MKHYNTIFDIFLYESVFVFFFGSVLYLLDDPASRVLIPVAAVSFLVALALGVAGKMLNLFQNEDPHNDF